MEIINEKTTGILIKGMFWLVLISEFNAKYRNSQGVAREGCSTRTDELGAKGGGRAGAGSALADKGTVPHHQMR